MSKIKKMGKKRKMGRADQTELYLHRINQYLTANVKAGETFELPMKVIAEVSGARSLRVVDRLLPLLLSPNGPLEKAADRVIGQPVKYRLKQGKPQ